MLEQFRARGIEFAGVYHCPFHPTAGVGPYRRESFDRKPNPGMLLKAAADLRLDLGRSAFVGDKDSDMAAGRSAGVGHLFLLDGDATATGRAAPGQEDGCETARSLRHGLLTDLTVVRSLHDAATQLRLLIERSGPPKDDQDGRRVG
jgi:histidinol phosphatase-like enzyme